MIKSIKKYNTRLYLNYDRCMEIYEALGEDKFIQIIMNCVVITLDKKSKDFLTSISDTFTINE